MHPLLFPPSTYRVSCIVHDSISHLDTSCTSSHIQSFPSLHIVCFVVMHDSVPHQNTICAFWHSLERILATHLRTACVGYKHQSSMLDCVNQSWYHVENLRATDETHKVVGFGNTNGFFDGHGRFAVAGNAVVVWIGVVLG